MIGMISRLWPMTLVSATPSSGAINASFPASNTVNNDLGRIMSWVGSSANATLSLKYDLGAARQVDTFALLWHTGVNSDGVTINAYSDAGFTNQIYTSGAPVTPITGVSSRDSLTRFKMLMTLAVAVTARYWEIVYTDVSGGSFSLSRAFIGLMYPLAYGASEMELSGKDLNQVITTEVGQERSQEDATLIRPVISVTYNYEKSIETTRYYGATSLSLGTSRPLLVCADLTSGYMNDMIAFGRPEQVVSHKTDTYDIWQTSFVITSIGP